MSCSNRRNSKVPEVFVVSVVIVASVEGFINLAATLERDIFPLVVEIITEPPIDPTLALKAVSPVLFCLSTIVVAVMVPGS